MAAVDVAQENASLSELIDRAESGETVEIVRSGRIVARLVPVALERDRQPIDWDTLDRLRADMPMSTWTVEEMRRHDLL